MPDSGTFRLEVFSGSSGLEQLKPHWKNMMPPQEATGFYHCAEWYAAYLHALDDNPEAWRFYGVFEGEQLAAVFPLRQRDYRACFLRFHALEIPRHSHMPLTDIVLPETGRSHDVWRWFLKQLRRQHDVRWDFIRIPKVPQKSALSAVLDSVAGPEVLQNRTHACRTCACAPPEELSQKISRSFRKSLKNAKNRLARSGTPRLAAAQTSEEMEQVFQDFLRLEASGWKGRGGSAIAQDPQLTAFYRKLTETFGPAHCLLDSLTVDGEAIAADFNLLTGSTLYGLKTGVDDQYRWCSPGHLLIEYELTHADTFPIKPETVSFVGEAPWTSLWRPESIDVFDVYIANASTKGRAVLVYAALHHHLKMLYRRFIKPLVNKLKRAPAKKA